MSLRGSYIAFSTVATMIVSPLANAATTSTVMPFPTPTITNPCNGEDVNVSGNVHVTIGATIDGNGGRHIRRLSYNNYARGNAVGTGSWEPTTPTRYPRAICRFAPPMTRA